MKSRITRLLAAIGLAAGLAAGVAAATGPDMHYHGTPTAICMYHHGTTCGAKSGGVLADSTAPDMHFHG